MKTLVAFIIGLVFIPVIVAIAGILGWLPSDATSEPPKWESSAGMRALDASLEKRSAKLSNPVQANDPSALAAGAKIYSDNCAECHGSAKGPSDLGAKSLYPRAPQFLQEGSDVTPSEAFAAIHDGIRYSGMGAWHGQLKDEDIWKVANYVASQRGKGGAMKDMD
ncbi:MAG TPA: c-type cytochrome [Sphingomicrobium sp.]|nr:c-type cytochrome [Sphingomicrobium sp.]